LSSTQKKINTQRYQGKTDQNKAKSEQDNKIHGISWFVHDTKQLKKKIVLMA
jgi:hypothetical protein